jgi:plasmid stabilization system protein ParE
MDLPRYEVHLTAQAEADLGVIAGVASPGALTPLTGLLDRIALAIDRLEHLPYRHAIQTGRRRPSQAVRRVPVTPFVIYYRVDEVRKRVDIVTIRHGARRRPRTF